jgi:hypothetical protein
MYVHDYLHLCLAKARHDDRMRAAARSRLAAQARRARGPHRSRVIAAPVARLALLRPRKATASPADSI